MDFLLGLGFSVFIKYYTCSNLIPTWCCSLVQSIKISLIFTPKKKKTPNSAKAIYHQVFIYNFLYFYIYLFGFQFQRRQMGSTTRFTMFSEWAHLTILGRPSAAGQRQSPVTNGPRGSNETRTCSHMPPFCHPLISCHVCHFQGTATTAKWATSDDGGISGPGRSSWALRFLWVEWSSVSIATNGPSTMCFTRTTIF